MSQHELDLAVARATGEDFAEVRRRGFSCADPGFAEYDPEPYGLPPIVDWDEVDQALNVAIFERKQYRPAAA